MFRMISFALAAALAAGCDTSKPTKPAPAGGPSHDHDDHSHDRDGMMLEDFGPYHAGLTAHMGKDERNLEIVLETIKDKPPKPVALPLKEFKATAKRAGDDTTYNLVFKPGPKDERKTDKDGECSRFEAEAPWMKPDDKITVTAEIDLAGKPRTVEWKDFSPKKYSHKH